MPFTSLTHATGPLRGRRMLAFGLAAALGVTSALVDAFDEAIVFETVALTDSEAYGPQMGPGVTFFALRAPVINNTGDIAFYAGLAGTPIGPPSIWKASGPARTLLAGTGAEGPGPSNLEGVSFLGLTISSQNEGLNLSDGGHVLLSATLTGTGITSANRDVLALGTGPLAVVARSDVEDELGPGVEAGTTFGTLTDIPFSLTANGALAFHSSLAGPLVTSATNRGIWSTLAGAPALVARSGVDDQTGPGLGAGVVFTLPFAGGADSAVAAWLNEAGDVIFRGTIAGPGVGSNNYGFWKATPAGLQSVLRVGDAMPGLGTLTTILSGGRKFGWNAASQLAFPITVNGGPGVSFSDVVRIDTAGATTITSLARTGVVAQPLAPADDGIGAGHAFVGFVGDASGTGTYMNASGEVAFQATYSGPAGSGNRGIFVNAAGVNRIIASTDFADDILGPGLGPDFEFFSFSTLHMNRCGQVVIAATALSPTVTAQGLWAWTGARLMKIAFPGELFDVDPSGGEDLRAISEVFVELRGSGGNDSRPRALNDTGTAVFQLLFEGGTRGIFTAKIPLEGAAERCVPNVPPTADAGEDRIARFRSEVTLDGEGSVDADEGPQPLSYEWSQTGGPAVVLSSNTAPNPTFTALVPGIYTFSLVVSDGEATSAADEVTITFPIIGDIDLDGDVDIDDLALVEAALGTPASGPNDIRDLNGNLTIDADDADLLKALCTHPQCAREAAADLGITVAASTLTPKPGDTITFTATVTNHGPSQADDVVVQEQPASGYRDVAPIFSATQGTYAWDTGQWTVGTLASGATATLTRFVSVQPDGDYAKTYTIAASSLPDPIPGNNTATVTPTPEAVTDIGVAVSVDNATPNWDDVLTFTVTVTNHGSTSVAGIVIDELPADGYSSKGLTTVPSQGVYNNRTQNWVVGDLAAGASATLPRKLRVLSTGSYTKTFTRTSSTPADTNPANDTASTSPEPLDTVDLALTASVNDLTPDWGDTVIFTVVVTNQGPATATDLVIQENANPTGYIGAGSASVTTGSFSKAVGGWKIDELASGASATLTRQLTVGAGAESYEKRYTLSASSPVDTNAGNNAAVVTPIPLDELDLEITASVNDLTPNYGDKIVFTVQITNHGPARATDLVMIETGDTAGYVGTGKSSVTVGTFSNDKRSWKIKTLASGATATLTRQLTVAADAEGYVVRFSLVGFSPSDTNGVNNTVEVTPIPLSNSDLEVAVNASSLTPSPGDTLTFTVTLTNHGPARATLVTLTEAPASGYTNASAAASATQGSFKLATGVWAVGTLASGASATLTRRVRVLPAGEYTKRFTKTSSTPSDPNAANDVATVTPVPQ